MHNRRGIEGDEGGENGREEKKRKKGEGETEKRGERDVRREGKKCANTIEKGNLRSLLSLRSITHAIETDFF